MDSNAIDAWIVALLVGAFLLWYLWPWYRPRK